MRTYFLWLMLSLLAMQGVSQQASDWQVIQPYTFGAGQLFYYDFNGDSIEDVMTFDGGTSDWTRVPLAIFFYDSTVFAHDTISKNLTFSKFGDEFYRVSDVFCGDIDNDVDIDFALATSIGIYLYENDGNGSFTKHKITGTNSRTLAFIDVNNDGLEDIIRDRTSSEHYVLWNAGDFSFNDSTLIEGFNLQGRDYQVADFNQDGWDDLLTNENSGYNIRLNQGDSTFQFIYHSEIIGDIQIEDLDNDGDLDLMGLENESRIKWCLLDMDDQIYQEGTRNYSSLGAISALDCADMDNDGQMDIIMAYASDFMRGTYVIYNISPGEYGGLNEYHDYNCLSVLGCDIDKDGDHDIISGSMDQSGSYRRSPLTWMRQDSLNHFSFPELFVPGYGTNDEMVAFGDIDSDGDKDLLTVYGSDPRLVWVENDGEGVFENLYSLSDSGFTPNDAITIDIDLDGDFDVVTAGGPYIVGDSRIIIYENVNNGESFEEKILHLGFGEQFSGRDLRNVDFNLDGIPDFLLWVRNSSTSAGGFMLYAQNLGDFQFQFHYIYPSTLEMADFEIVDYDFDGDDDIVYMDVSSDVALSWIENDSVFLPSQLIGEFSVSGSPRASLKTADIDSDMDIDFFFSSSNDLYFAENQEDSILYSALELYVLGSDSDFNLRDVDNDSDLDIIIADGAPHLSFFSDGQIVFLKNHQGQFLEEHYVSYGPYASTELLLEDIDNDGFEDIVTNIEYWGTSWLENDLGKGCTDSLACNYNQDAIEDDDSCCYTDCGCTAMDASNFNADAICDDGSCLFDLEGLVFHDTNGDGKYTGEYGLANRKVILQPANLMAITNAYGEYRFLDVPIGEYQLQIVTDDIFSIATTVEFYDFEVTNQDFDLKEFGLNNEETIDRIEIVTENERLRLGTSKYFSYVKNTGTTSIGSSVATIQLDSSMSLNIANTLVNELSPNTFEFEVPGLRPGQTYSMSFSTNNNAAVGDTMNIHSQVLQLQFSDTLFFDEHNITGPREGFSVGIYHHTVFPVGFDEPHFIYNSDTLRYKMKRVDQTAWTLIEEIHFTDSLDTNVYIESFQPILTDFAGFTNVDMNTKVVTVDFESIGHPSSDYNAEVMSIFEVGLLPGLAPGTQIDSEFYSIDDFNQTTQSGNQFNTIFACELVNSEHETDSLNLCQGEELELIAESVFPFEYNWYLNGDFETNSDSLIHVFNEIGEYDIELIHSYEFAACTDTALFDLSVHEIPISTIDFDTLVFCEGDSIYLSTTPMNSIEWNLSGNQINDQTQVTVTEGGWVTLQVASAFCASTVDSVFVMKNPLPEGPGLLASDSEFCEGDSVFVSIGSVLPNLWLINGMEYENLNGYWIFESSQIEVNTIENGCFSESENLTITGNAIPEEAGLMVNPYDFCEGDSSLVTVDSNLDNQWLINGVSFDNLYEFWVYDETSIEVNTIENNCISSIEMVEVIEHENPETPLINYDSGVLSTTLYSDLNYQWYYNGEEISGATENEYLSSAIGAYYVIVSNWLGCESISAEFIITSLNDVMPLSISLRPNPASSILLLELKGVHKNVEIQIYNSIGELVLMRNTSRKVSRVEFDVSNFASGIYSLRVLIEAELYSMPFLIEH